MGIPEMAAKGERKLRAKSATMKAGWEAARSRMIEGYRGVGFGPTRTSAYEAGISAGIYTAPDPSKWSRNWQSKMRE